MKKLITICDEKNENMNNNTITNLRALLVCILVLYGIAIMPSTLKAVPIDVPGTSDPWLSGMPDGSTASGFTPIDPGVDVAPSQSPVQITELSVVPGSAYAFSVSGLVTNAPSHPLCGPDGNPSEFTAHYAGPQNGIADLTAPVNSLVGIFLGEDQPNVSPPPTALNFGTSASLDYLTLEPLLKQPFFIGDGLTSSGTRQQIIAPSGATRIFLGTMDGWEWFNNIGSFTVEIVPEPATLLLLGLGALILSRRRRA